jgi:uncharacterized protein
MIHQYQLNGLNIVLDVDTSSVLTVDDLTYKMIAIFQEKSKEEIIEMLSSYYSKDDIIEAYNEILEMKERKLLFTEINYDRTQYKNNDLIKSVCLHVAHDCNMKCEYCFAAQGDFDGVKMLMPLDVGKKAIDFLIEQSKNRKSLELDFFGGEPLMNFDVVKELVTYGNAEAQKRGKDINFTMTTNGVLLDKETREYLDKYMGNIVVSLDGRKEVNDRMRKTLNDKGSYDVIFDNIKAMADMRIGKDHYVRGTFTKNNLDFAKDVQFFAEKGFTSISIEPVVTEPEHDYALSEEDLPVILKEYDKLALKYLKRHEEGLDYSFFHFVADFDQGPCVYKRLSGCGAGKDYVAITPEGDIYPCHQFVGNEDFKMGDVFNGIQNKEIKEIFDEANLLNKEACKNCWAKYFCGGGCHANAYNMNGTLMEPHELSCKIERRRVENAIMISVLEGQE